jgi:calcineurin-like phosphoesterase family protein
MRYWTSDFHFGHANIQRFCPGRPGSNLPDDRRVAYMNDAIVDNFNSILTDDDELWVLGDVAMGPFKESIQNVARIRGKKMLCAGNHDRCWSGMSEKERRKNTEIYREVGFTIMPEIMDAVLDDWIPVGLSHFPYEGDSHGEDRYPQFRPVDNGGPLIHGHVHDEWKINTSSNGSLMINVGVDVWGYFPVSETVLANLIMEYGV